MTATHWAIEGRDWDAEGLAHCAICVTAAVIGGIGAAGSVASAAIGSSAAQSAANTQAAAADRASAASQAMYQQTRADLAPYRQVGEDARAGYENLLGLHGAGNMNAMLASTPGYQFALQQGLIATQSGFASKGLGQSGAAMKGAAQYAEGLAGTTYQSVLGNYYNALQLGQSAAAQTGQVGVATTAQSNQAITSGAAAQAAGTVGAANATIGGINSLTSSLSNALLTPSMFSTLAGGGGLYANTPLGNI